MLRSFLALLVLAIVFSACLGARNTHLQNVGSAGWLEDLDVLVRELPKRHADPFHVTSQQAFGEAARALREAIPGLSTDEIVVGFVRLVAMLRDGHTGVVMPHTWYPLRLYYFGDELYVVAALEPYRRAVGQRVVKIGGQAIGQVAAAVDPLIDRDNDMELLRKIPLYMTIPEVLHGLHVVDDVRQANFTFETPAGETFDLTLAPLPSQADVDWLTAPMLAGSPVPLALQQPNVYYWYTYLPDSRTLYLKYNVCNDQRGKPSLARFTREMFDFVDRNAVDRFVVDLRHNPGGNFHKSRPLVEGIEQRERLRQRGHLFVITSRNTGSAATVTAAQLRQSLGAIVVGEGSRANPNFTYNAERFHLPNSGLEVEYTQALHRPFPGLDDVVPVDVPVEQTFEDYRAGRDPILERVLGYEQE